MKHVDRGSIAYNGPRAGVNFDDGLGGGSVVTRNVLFNFCRESSDRKSLNCEVSDVIWLLNWLVAAAQMAHSTR